MADELVIDASVAAKCFLIEQGSEEAWVLANSPVVFIAPELVMLELAGIAAKKVRGGEIGHDAGAVMLDSAPRLFDEFAPNQPHLARAFELASRHSISVCDGLYLALAEARRTVLVTADMKLVERALAAGLAALVRPLA
jgi:predicted nucleic acid-binding protein